MLSGSNFKKAQVWLPFKPSTWPSRKSASGSAGCSTLTLYLVIKDYSRQPQSSRIFQAKKSCQSLHSCIIPWPPNSQFFHCAFVQWEPSDAPPHVSIVGSTKHQPGSPHSPILWEPSQDPLPSAKFDFLKHNDYKTVLQKIPFFSELSSYRLVWFLG